MVKRFKANKLIRDKAPEAMKKEKITSSTTHVPAESMIHHLCMKLEEETAELREFSQSKSMNKEEATRMITDEMADVVQVMMGIAKEKGIKWEDVEAWRVKKLAEKGAFEKGTHMDWVEIPKDHPKMHRYHGNHRYPEVSHHEGTHHTAHAAGHHSATHHATGDHKSDHKGSKRTPEKK